MSDGERRRAYGDIELRMDTTNLWKALVRKARQEAVDEGLEPSRSEMERRIVGLVGDQHLRRVLEDFVDIFWDDRDEDCSWWCSIIVRQYGESRRCNREAMGSLGIHGQMPLCWQHRDSLTSELERAVFSDPVVAKRFRDWTGTVEADVLRNVEKENESLMTEIKSLETRLRTLNRKLVSFVSDLDGEDDEPIHGEEQ